MSDADGERLRATFEVYQDGRGEWRWRLRHRNGNIIADSAEGYSSKISALNAVDTVRSVARDARIDLERTDGEPVPDGGTITADPDPPALPQVIAEVLDDTAGGVDRQILIERVAEVSGATIEEVEEALGGEVRHGRAIVVDGEVRKTPDRRFAGGGRR